MLRSLMSKTSEKDNFLEDLLAFEAQLIKANAPNHSSVFNKMDDFIRKIPKSSLQKNLKEFLNYLKNLPNATPLIFRAFIKHHINPLSPQQFKAEFQLVLPELIKENLFEAFVAACEALTPVDDKKLEPGEKKDEKKTDNPDEIITQKVNHIRVFFEVEEPSNNHRPKPKEQKKSDSPKKYKNQQDWNPQDWFEFIKKAMVSAQKEAEQKTVEQLAPLLQKQASTWAEQLTNPDSKRERNTLLATMQKEQQQNNKKVKQAAEDAANPQKWLRLLNCCIPELFFDPVATFQLLKDHPPLSIAYLVELLKKSDYQGDAIDNRIARQQLIANFLKVNDKHCSDPEWIKLLFLQLSNLFSRSELNRGVHYALIDEILKNSVIKNNALAALAGVIENFAEAFAVSPFNPALLDPCRYPFWFALQIAEHLINKHGINPLNVKLANGKSFFEMVLLQWQQLYQPHLPVEPKELVPHYYQHSKDGPINLYQIILDYGNERLKHLTHYVLWSELLPLLSDKILFIKHLKNLFGTALTTDNINDIRNHLINSDTFQLSDELLNILKMAVLAKMRELDIDINHPQFDFINAVLKLTRKQKIILFHKEFDTTRQQYVLKMTEQTQPLENKDGKGGIGLLHKDNQLYLLREIGHVIENQSIRKRLNPAQINGRAALVEMRYLFDGFVRKIFHNANYDDKDIPEQLNFVPEMLCSLENNLQDAFIQHIFGEPDLTQPTRELKTADEVKQSDKTALVEPNQSKANVIFRMLGLYQPDPALQPGFLRAKDQIIKKYGQRYSKNPYFILYANNISPLFYESFKENLLAQQFILEHANNPALQKLAREHKPGTEETRFDLVRLLDVPKKRGDLLDENFLAELAELKPNPKSYEILADLIPRYDNAEADIQLFKTWRNRAINVIRNLGPEFYLSFTQGIAKQFILEQANNPSLKKLANGHKLNNTESESDLIRLLDVPRHNSKLLDEEFLTQLDKIQNNPFHQKQADNNESKDNGTREKIQRKVFEIFRTLMIQFDARTANPNLYQTLRAQIVDIVSRFHTSDDHSEILTILNQISAIVSNIHELDSNPQKDMLQLVNDIRKKYLSTDQDIQEAIQLLLEQKDAEKLVLFIENTLNKRDLTARLTQTPHQALLKQILQFATPLEVKEKDATRQKHNDHAARIIPLLTTGKSSVNFNERLASGETWLEWAFKEASPSVLLQLIEAGANVFADCVDPKKPFNEVFLDAIKKTPKLLQNPCNLKIYKICLAGKTWIQSLKPAEFIEFAGMLQGAELDEFIDAAKNITNPTLLKQIGLAALRTDRFDLLEKMDTNFRRLVRHPIWQTDKKMDPEFDAGFRDKWAIPPENKYEDLLNLPGFYTAHELIPVFYKEKKYDRSFLEMGLKTKNDKPCTKEKADEFFAQLAFLHTHDTEVWSKSENPELKEIFPIIIEALTTYASQLSLQDIISIIGSLTSIKDVPKDFPIREKLAAIFKNPPRQTEFENKAPAKRPTWEESLKELHATFRVFNIAGKDPKSVEEEFLRKPADSFAATFDEIVHPGIVHYAMGVFKEVTTLLAQDKVNPQEILKDPVKTFHDSNPGKWNPHQKQEEQARNRQEDIYFFSAICKASQQQLEKTPFHTQLVTNICMMYAVPASTLRLLVDVPTNGGKTIILAITVLCLMKQDPKTNFMPVLTTSVNLAQKNYIDNKKIFDLFGIRCSADIADDKAVVRYTTCQELLFKLIEDSIKRKKAGLPPLTKAEKEHWKLILDETDVDLWSRIMDILNAMLLEVPEMDNVILAMWDNAHIGDFEDFKYMVRSSPGFRSLPSDLEQHVEDHFRTFYSVVYWTKKKQRDENTNENGAMKKTEDYTGQESQNLYGGYAKPQFIQLSCGAPRTHYKLVEYCLSHLQGLDQFPIIIGASGTLANSREQTNGYQITLNCKIARSPRFTGNKLTIEPPTIYDEHKAWVAGIRARATSVLKATPEKASRPFLTVVKTKKDVDMLADAVGMVEGCQLLQRFKGGETQKQYNEIMAKAVLAGTWTILSIEHTRGDDYSVINELIDKAGGVALDIATPLEFLSLYLQTINRTGRGESRGQVFSDLKKSELVTFFKKADMFPSTIDAKTTPDLMREAWTTLETRDLAKKKTPGNLASDLSYDFYEVSQKTGPKLSRAFTLFLSNVRAAIPDDDKVRDPQKEDKFIREYNSKFGTFVKKPA